MPRYINTLSNPVNFNNTAFIPNQEVETYDTLDTGSFIIGTKHDTYNIVVGVSDILDIRFNEETAWTSITLTPGAAQTAANVVADIEAVYPGVASDEGGRVRIDAPIMNNIFNAIYIGTTSTSAVILGFATDDVNPVSCSALQAFKISQNAEPYNVTSANNTFIFKANNGQWAITTLTVGAARTAAEIAAEINYAYECTNTDATKVALAVIPIVGGGTYIKLLAPIYSNTKSILFIKSTNNTALTLLGFNGDDYDAVDVSFYPYLFKTADLPLYNPIINEETLTFIAAETKYYYLSNPNKCRIIQLFRSAIAAGETFSCYVESTSNTPAFTVSKDENFEINSKNIRITRLIITASAAGSLTIREL